MKIYYSVSVRGGILSKEHIVEQINILKRYGIVLTEHLASSNQTVVDMGKTDKDIYQKDMELLANADVFVADISAPSLGVGFMICKAISLNKPVLCVHNSSNKTKISAMINGCPDIYVDTYDDINGIDGFEHRFKQFLLGNAHSQKIFLCGPPGSGKSTVAKNLSEKFGLVNVSTGQVLRDIAKNPKTPLSLVLNEYMSKGQLVPAHIMSTIVFNRLTEPDCLENGFVLDGYPPSLDDLMNLRINNIYPDLVFNFECLDETAINRQCFRAERVTDNEEKAKERMKVFHEGIPDYQTLCNKWFPETPIIRINAEADTNTVSSIVLNTIGNWLTGYAGQHKSSYFPIYPFSDDLVKSSRFHFHIDTPNNSELLDLLRELYAKCPELHGQIKVYPIRNLWLGSQAKNCETYGSMINFHEISDTTNESFVTGKLGNGIDSTLMNKIFSIVKNRSKPNSKVMVEIEQYTGEWLLPAQSNSAQQTNVYEPIDVDMGVFSDYASNVINKVPPIELHHGFDIPKNNSNEEMPIALAELNDKCKRAGLDNGGWFIFKNEKMWAYRSNEFSFDSLENSQKKLFEQAYLLRQIVEWMGFSVDIGSSLELVHGIWIF